MMDSLFTMYPSLKDRPIVFAGESYAARYIAHTTAYWQIHRPAWIVKLLVLNSPSLDMRHQTPAFLQLVASHHLVSRNHLEQLKSLYADQVRALDRHDLATAIEKRVLMLDSFREWSGNVNMWDLRMGGAPYRCRKIKQWCDTHLAQLHVRDGVTLTEAVRENLVFAHLRVSLFLHLLETCSLMSKINKSLM